MYQPSMKTRMEELEREKAEITARLSETPADVPDVHPNIAELYRAQVARLTDALASPDTHAEAAADVRALIGEVVITPGAARGEFTAVLRGALLGILGLVAEEKSAPGPEVLTNAAAGPRNQYRKARADLLRRAFSVSGCLTVMRGAVAVLHSAFRGRFRHRRSCARSRLL